MGWSSLPAELLLAVFSGLPADADRIRFRGVCAAWRAAAWAWRPRPWLVGSCTDLSGQRPVMSSFWFSRAGGLLPFAAYVPPGLEYLSSSHGYVALADPTASAKSLTLVNPVSGRRIALPPIGFYKKWLDVATVVLSADPDTTPGWAALAVGFPTNCLASYSSITATWTPLEFRVAGYAGVEYYNERFYVAFRSQIWVCELAADPPAVIPLENVDDGLWTESSGAGRRVLETHLVECDGELLLVSVRDDAEYTSDGETGLAGIGDDSGGDGNGGEDARRVEVHLVQWVDEEAVRLVRQTNLGGRALFLGRNRAFALWPVEFPACRGNCVYLVDCQGHPDGRVRVVDMESQLEDVVCAAGDPPGFPLARWARRGWFFPNY